ncbi:MAG: T9SS type A sorting domain-containing protein [Saprospiraceae bacterium]
MTTSIHALLIDRDTIVTFGGAIDVPGHYGVQISKYDTLGNLLGFKTYFHSDGKPYVLSNSAGFIKTSDGGYLGVGDVNLGDNVVVFKFSHSGDLEWLSDIAYSNLRVIYAFDPIECNGGYMLAGLLQYLDYDVNGFICKIDFEGNLLWRKDYGVPGLMDVAPFIRKKDENSFLVSGGQNNGAGLGFPGFWMRSWVFEIDSTGTVLSDWKSEIAENVGNCKAELSGDHELVLITSRLYANYPNAAKLELTARKLDTDDWHTVWQTSQTPPTMAYLVGWYDIKQSPADGGWDLVGTFLYEPNGAVLGGLTAHLNPDGERAWIRQDTVYLSPLLNANENYLVSMGHLSSGSIVAGGYVLSTEGGDLHQEAWLLKLSPDGCIEPGDCATVPSHEPNTASGPSFLNWEVFPNPATSYTLLVPDRDLQGKQGKVALYNVQGKLLREFAFTVPAREAIRVDLSGLAPGMYTYQVQVEGQGLGGGKIMVMW